MSKITIKKTSNYTTIDNNIFNNKNLSLKARGLLATMLSLPQEWDYSVEGLSVILKEGKDCIRATLNELEENGYLVRNRVRDDNGQLKGVEYFVYEIPQTVENTEFEPESENPTLVNPILGNPTQLNKQEINETNNKNYSATPSHECDILIKAKSITNDSKVINAIECYLSKYEIEMGANHPDVTYSAMSRVIENIYCVLQDVWEDVKSDNGLEKMIDRHFDTNYGQPIDYKIQHFGTEGVLMYQARNCGYIDGYRD